MKKLSLVILVAFAMGAGAVWVFGIPAERLVSLVTREFEAQTGYRLHIDGPAKLTWRRSIEFAGEKVRLIAPDGEGREPLLSAAQIRLAVPLTSLFSDRIQIAEVALAQPVLQIRFGDDPAASARPANNAKAADGKGVTPFTIERVSIRDGSVVYRQVKRELQTRFDSINLDASIVSGGTLRFQADARWDGEPMKITAVGTGAATLFDGRPLPIEMSVEAPSLLRAQLTMSGNLAVNGKALVLADLKGAAADTKVAGAASFDWSKPKLKIAASLDVERLQLFESAGAPVPARSKGARSNKLWSEQPIDVAWLHMIDATIQAKVRDLRLRTVRLAAAEATTTIRDGVLSVAMVQSDLYGGGATGKLSIDATRPVPSQALRIELSGLQALPFLSDAIGFTKVEGRLHAKTDLVAAGASMRAMVAGLAGSGEILFENGAIRDVSMPGLAQSLMRGPLAGWQQNQPEKTEFASFESTFEARGGKLRTEDLKLMAPVFRMNGAGTADLLNASVDFRVEPSITLSGSRAGRRSGDNAISVPVTIRGPWDNPQINAEVDKLLQNPDALISKLRIFGDEFMSSSKKGGGRTSSDDKTGERDQQGSGDMLRGLMQQFMR